jgi:hypothetical protein
MLVKIAGRVRGLFAGNYPENREDEQGHINNRGDLIVSQSLPPKAELVRMGDSWQCKTTTGLQAKTALPTTANIAMGLWNGEPASGKSYIIDSVAADCRIVDVTQVGTFSLFCQMGKTPIAAPADAALAIASLSGKTYGGKARTVTDATTLNDGWFPCGSSPAVGPTLAGAVWKVMDVDLRGFYIVPPGGAFYISGVQVGGGAAGVFYTIRWHEALITYKS